MIDFPQTHTALAEWPAMFIGLASLVSAIGAALAAVIAAKNNRKIGEIHDATNGMKDALVKEVGDKRYAQGRLHGEKFPRARRVRSKPKAKKR